MAMAARGSLPPEPAQGAAPALASERGQARGPALAAGPVAVQARAAVQALARAAVQALARAAVQAPARVAAPELAPARVQAPRRGRSTARRHWRARTPRRRLRCRRPTRPRLARPREQRCERRVGALAAAGHAVHREREGRLAGRERERAVVRRVVPTHAGGEDRAAARAWRRKPCARRVRRAPVLVGEREQRGRGSAHERRRRQVGRGRAPTGSPLVRRVVAARGIAAPGPHPVGGVVGVAERKRRRVLVACVPQPVVVADLVPRDWHRVPRAAAKPEHAAAPCVAAGAAVVPAALAAERRKVAVGDDRLVVLGQDDGAVVERRGVEPAAPSLGVAPFMPRNNIVVARARVEARARRRHVRRAAARVAYRDGSGASGVEEGPAAGARCIHPGEVLRGRG
eukprot:352825-Chlamydomonas_euryale.AAC.7